MCGGGFFLKRCRKQKADHKLPVSCSAVKVMLYCIEEWIKTLEDFGMKFRFFVGLVGEVCLWPVLPSATSVRSRCFGFIFLRIFPAVHLIHCQLMLFRLTLMAHKFKLQNKKNMHNGNTNNLQK